MRKWVYFIGVLFITSSFTEVDDETFVSVSQRSFGAGEVLEYKLNYGAFTVGKAQMKVHDLYYKINGRDCYRIDIFGRTSGAVDWVARVNDNWGAYIDTAALVPHISYRKIEEGRYRKNEVLKFDHNTDMVEAKVINNATGDFKEPEYFQVPNNVRDIVGGLFYLRTFDFNGFSVGDTITMEAFFEDTVYDFEIRYMGTDEIRTRAGKFNALKLVPIMPDNKLFAGEDAVAVWFSDDMNRIPLKVEANLIIGKASCELIKYEGLRN
jgi:hypothetical protein